MRLWTYCVENAFHKYIIIIIIIIILLPNWFMHYLVLYFPPIPYSLHSSCHLCFIHAFIHSLLLPLLSTLRVTWTFMRHVTGDMDFHEYTSRVTLVHLSTRHGWHENSWVLRHGYHEYSWVLSRVTWKFTSTRHWWHCILAGNINIHE